MFFAFFQKPVQVLELSGLDVLPIFEPVQVLEPWVLKNPAQAQKNAKNNPLLDSEEWKTDC